LRGGQPAAQLIPQDTPRIGALFRVELNHLPLDVALVITGFDPANSSLGPLPLDLGTFGIPGCTLYASLDFVTFVVGATGHARFALAIPDDPVFVGTRFQQQAVVPDPTAGNALGVVLSDAMTAQIGR